MTMEMAAPQILLAGAHGVVIEAHRSRTARLGLGDHHRALGEQRAQRFVDCERARYAAHGRDIMSTRRPLAARARAVATSRHRGGSAQRCGHLLSVFVVRRNGVLMEMVGHLNEAFDLERRPDGTFLARSLAEVGEGDFVFGGQFVAQMLLAGNSVDAAKVVKSIHTLIGRPAVRQEPYVIDVEQMHSGRAFTTAVVTAGQGGRLCARALVLLHQPEADVIRHSRPAPTAPPPDEATPYDGYHVGAAARTLGGRIQRIVDGVDVISGDTVAPGLLRVWARLDEGGPDPRRAQAFLAFESAGPNIATAMLPHPGLGTGSAHATISTGIMTHTMTFHEATQAADWHLLEFRSPYAGHGRAYGRGDAFTADGRLVASWTQDSIIRNYPEDTTAFGSRTVL
jgi:acyl-CoA thioesterase II